ncbi:MAG: NAD-dependent epimerase/dehydratase family protein [Alphaproteobacteria bacterium]
MFEHTQPESANPSRVVVVGATGVIGKALLAGLQAADVATLGLGSRDLDLATAGASESLSKTLRESDAVVILSALTPDKGRGVATFMKNLAMAQTVCDALHARPVSHIVYMSSDAVYPMTNGLVNEETAAQPPDLYGTMHYAREMMFRDAAGSTPLAILRCTLVLSANDTHNSYGPNRFRRLAQEKGEIALGGEGEENRDHIADVDVAEFVRRVLVHRSKGVINLATGRSSTFRDVAELVADCCTPKPVIKGSQRNNPITHRHFDVTALHRAFPEFVFTALPDAIRRVAAEEGR